MEQLHITYLSKDYPSLNKRGYLYQIVQNRALTNVRHDHDFFELFIILNGTAVHFLDGKTTEIKELEFVFLEPKNIHCFKKQSNDLHAFSLSILPAKFMSFLSAFGFTPIYGKVYTCRNREIIKEIQHLPSAHSSMQPFLINAIVGGLLSEIIKNNELQLDNAPQPLLSANEKFQQPQYISGGVKTLSDLSGYSRMHLCRLIEKHYKKTPVSFILDIRMKLAAEYLLNTTYSVEKIASSVGFLSISHFYAAFKNYYGCTPKQYRQTKSSLRPPI